MVNKMFTLHFIPNAQNLYLERDSQNNLAVLRWNLHISFSDLPPKIQVQYSPNCNPKVEAIHGKVHITGLQITHRPIKKLIQTFIDTSSSHVVRYSRKKNPKQINPKPNLWRTCKDYKQTLKYLPQNSIQAKKYSLPFCSKKTHLSSWHATCLGKLTVAWSSLNSETLRDLELPKGLLFFVFYHVKGGGGGGGIPVQLPRIIFLPHS